MELQEGKQYTLKEVVGMTIDTLNGINVPVCLSQQISVPICNAVGYLQQCMEAFNREEFEAKMKEEAAKQAEAEIPEAETTDINGDEEPEDGSADAAPAEEP